MWKVTKPLISIIYYAFFCLCFNLASNKSSAQTFDFKGTLGSAILSGSDLYYHGLPAIPDTLTVWCNDWDFITMTPTWGDSIKFKSNISFVTFSVNDYSTITKYLSPISYNYLLAFHIYGFTNPLDSVYSYVVDNDTLRINYNNFNDNSAFQDIDLKKYANFYKLMVIVDGIYQDVGGTITPASLTDTTVRNFSVEASILSQVFDKHEYGIGAAVPPPVVVATPHPADNYLELHWNFVSGPTNPVNYELEWTYVDDYGVSLPSGTVTSLPSSSLYYNFAFNNTKVWLDSNDYRIPLCYSSGYIVYRVRAVRPDSNLFKYPVYGQWSQPADYGPIGGVFGLSSGFYQITPYTNDSLNWQYTVSFAEGGKYKNVVHFYDGLLKNRQSITRFNTSLNKLIVTNNIYDFEGRPSIKTLPSPTNTTSFNYLHNVTLNAATNLPYIASDFDTGFQNYHLIPPLASNAIANVYYSNNNPDTFGFQRFVPDAGGYPLIQTVYQPGFNDRISAQGGAGRRLQIGDTNYASYFYTGSAQQTINSLFGPNVGWSSFYTMTVSSDPNQQYTMMIKDYKDRLMASAFIGAGPDSSTHAITTINTPGPNFITQDLLFPSPPNQAIDTLAGTRIANVDYFSEASSTDSLFYLYSFAPYQACPGQYIYVAGHYNASVTDQFGNLVVQMDTVLGADSVSTINDTISSLGPVRGYGVQIGPYHVNKTLSFAPSDVTASLDTFFNMANCFLTEPYFIKQSVDNTVFPCPSSLIIDSTPCEKMQWQMMQQLFPGAIYGKFYVNLAGRVLGTGNSIFDMIDCETDTFVVEDYFTDSMLLHCFSPSATIGGDSIVIMYNHPTLGHYAYRCFCTLLTFPDTCVPATVTTFTTTATITALNLFHQTSSIDAPFLSGLSGMTGNYHLQANWNLETLSGGIVSGGTVVGSIQQRTGANDSTIIKLPVTVHGDSIYADLHALSPVGDSFLFSFSGLMHPPHTDSMLYFTDSVLVDSPGLDFSDALCHYRYQDTCTVPTLPTSITYNGVTYSNLRTMRADSFIMVYNGAIAAGDYSIAYDLLPLHPQYCELNNCFVDTFKTLVASLPNWQVAQSMNLFYLDSLIAHDPVKGMMASSGLYPSPFDSLATFQGGTVRLDSFAIMNAYCSCTDSVMYKECYSKMFAYEIANHLLINNTVKSFYYNNIVNTYFSNRQRFVGVLMLNGGEACPHCADARLNFDEGAAVLPGHYFPHDSTVFIYPDSTNAGWLATMIPDSERNNYDSALILYHSTDSSLAFGMIDTIMAHLSNCIAGNTTAANGIRDSLISMYDSGAVSMGNFSISQIKYALRTNGIAMNDLCNPYIFNFSQFGAIPTTNNCLSPSFYTGMGTFLSDPAVTGVLHSIGSVYSGFVLDTVHNLAEQSISRSLGNWSLVNLTADFNALNSLYTIYVTPSGGSSDTVRVFLHAPLLAPLLMVLTGYSIKTDCINSSMASASPGLISQYSFAAIAVSSVDSPICFMTGWMDSVQTMQHPNDPSGICVPCTQMKDLYAQFNDTLLAYGIVGSDHPYYSTMLTNFMNTNLQLQYPAGYYETFIQSCALADSMTMPQYTGYATYTFHSTADMNSFVSMLDQIDTNYSFDNSYRDSTYTGVPVMRVCVNLNTVPASELWMYKDTLLHYPGPYAARSVNVPLYIVGGTPGEIGFLYSDPSFPFTPQDSVIIDTTFIKYSGPSPRWIWSDGQFVLRDYYVISGAGAPASEISRAVYELSAYLYNSSVPGAVFVPEYMSTVNSDYFKPEKQAFLSYTYSNQTLPPYAVLNAIQAQMLTANISSYSPYSAFYSLDSLPGSGFGRNLYLWNASMNSRFYDTLQQIINLADPSSSGHIFQSAKSVSVPVPAPLQLTDYICSDNSYWYRYFTTGDTLFNVYLAFPSYIPSWLRPSYKVAGPVIPVPGDSLNRYFALPVVLGGTTDTIQLFGITSFVINKAIEMDNVVLKTTPGSGTIDTFDNCERQTLYSAINNGINNYNNYIDSVKNKITGDFKSYIACSVKEQQLLKYRNNETFYTLYNYDRAGNLQFTVTPAGNTPIPDTGSGVSLNQVDTSRINNTPITCPEPIYTKRNSYSYNSLNSVIGQKTINGGASSFFYDAANRQVFSQNAKQSPNGEYTYVIFDEQSRPIETGEVILTSPADTIVSHLNTLPFANVVNAIRVHDRYDVTMTIYDTASVNLDALPGLDGQQNLRKRVACMKYFDTLYATDIAFANYNYATYYSYDLLGTIQTLTQDFPELDSFKQRYKRIDYDYDVISGRVNMLSYNRGNPDQFYQRYYYDADNRITSVQTSSDGFIWNNEAAYSYYDHGPLARVQVGNWAVQGIDYAYTVQGWLKAMNTDTLNSGLDMGNDGSGGITATDAAAQTIDYFTGDYKPITASQVQHVAPQLKSLFNGNIARQTVAIDTFRKLNKQYVYDQFNRILSAQYAAVDPVYNTLTGLTDYYNYYSYDPDGNITNLTRYGNNLGSGALIMDSMRYIYPTFPVTDRLMDVYDTAANNYTNDIRQYFAGPPGRYQYDAIGNVTKDLVSGQDTVEWNLYNKVRATADTTDSSRMQFEYDPGGNRVAKHYTKFTATGRNQRDDYYVHDASGNILAIYRGRKTYDLSGNVLQQSLALAEHDIYGSSRLGIKEYYGTQIGESADYTTGTYDTSRLYIRRPWYSLEYQDVILADSTNLYGNIDAGIDYAQNVLGQKQYEVTDHLGNVLATVSDKRTGNVLMPVGGGSLTAGSLASIMSWNPIVISAHDYYPFGEYMPGRYMTDTNSSCLTTTSTGYTSIIIYHFTPFSLFALAPVAGGYYLLTGSGLELDTGPAGDGLTADITPIAPDATHIDMGLLAPPTADFLFQAIDDASGAILGSTTVLTGTAPGPISITPLSPIPHASGVTLMITSLTTNGKLFLSGVNVPQDTLIPHSVVSTVCNNDFYRYGYNGKLKDNEWAGLGNHYDYGARSYDSRIGRFISVDPERAKYPWQSPYAYANNTPIQAVDKEGKGAGYEALLFMAQQLHSTVSVGTSASVSFGVGASVAAGMAVDPKGNVALFASASMGSIDQTSFNIDKIGLGANVNGTASILPFKDVRAISGAGFSVVGSLYTPAGVGGGVSADFAVDNKGVHFQGFTASLGVGTAGGSVGVGGVQATNAILLSGSDYKAIVDGHWDKKGVTNAISWDRASNGKNMNNPSGFWDYTGKELVFTKVEGQENTYSVSIKLSYSFKTSGKGASEGLRDMQKTETYETGITVSKTDDYTYESKNLKK